MARTRTASGAARPGAAAPARNQGLGRIIVMVYAVFALSATARLRAGVDPDGLEPPTPAV